MENRHNRPIRYLVKDILLVTINAKWIHSSLALRLLKANLEALEDRCEILEFALRQPLAEMTEPITLARPLILGISVSIWNHTATLELLEELEKIWAGEKRERPIVVLGGPEVSHLPESAEIFRYADYVIRGEGEIAFRELCQDILANPDSYRDKISNNKFLFPVPCSLLTVKPAYHLYTDEDITRKLIYVEASRGCLFNCEYCLSAVKTEHAHQGEAVREFPLEPFFAEMDILIRRGVKIFKFLDRTFNINIKRAIQIMEFFLERIKTAEKPLSVHFEMAGSLFPPELREMLTRFPPGSLRLEVGVQTLNPEVAARINRLSSPEKELENLCFLREKTNAIIHADLIAGLPGEDLVSFGKGFDRLWQSLNKEQRASVPAARPRLEIQLGILKLLPGAPISRYSESFGMRYSPAPPYEVLETSVMSENDLNRIKNFARFWEIIVNRGDPSFEIQNLLCTSSSVFERFMALSDFLFASFGRNWGIDKNELRKAVGLFLNSH